MAKVIQGFATFTGGFLEQVAEGVRLRPPGGPLRRVSRAGDEVRETLTGRDVAFVVVTSPDPMAVSEAMFFVERLHEGSMAAEALVINRVRQAEDTVAPSTDRLAGILHAASVEPSTELGSGFARGVARRGDLESAQGRAGGRRARLMASVTASPRAAFDDDACTTSPRSPASPPRWSERPRHRPVRGSAHQGIAKLEGRRGCSSASRRGDGRERRATRPRARSRRRSTPLRRRADASRTEPSAVITNCTKITVPWFNRSASSCIRRRSQPRLETSSR
ncbi:MAG: hypothetical protein U0325_30115 [Polyangiales bacterium]